MVLKAADELRHPMNDDYYFRESVYFNFNDPVNEIGGWIYLWVVPNQPKPSGMLVSFYHGAWPDLKVNDTAMNSPGHRVTDGDKWVYCYKKDVDFLIDADFDDVELCGLKLKRLEPLKQYELSFDDGEGNGFDLRGNFTMPPYDYADGVHATPPWIAANRYHRAWRVEGALRVAGKTYAINCAGDSDHSWGQRHGGLFAQNLFKMLSFQTPDDALTVSVLDQESDGKRIALGYVTRNGVPLSAATVKTKAEYDENGVQTRATMTIVDEKGGVVNATFNGMHSYIGSGSQETFWGYEGVGSYEVEGHGKVDGLISYFWPARITPKILLQGDPE